MFVVLVCSPAVFPVDRASAQPVEALLVSGLT
jgi:hypothetical protein